MPAPTDAKLYLNRELGQIAFSQRVLEEAQDEQNPLLERVKFLAIVGSNLAEFFMVRIAGLKQQIEAGIVEHSIDGMTPSEQLVACRNMALQLMRDARVCLNQLLPQLAKAGVNILDYPSLDEEQKTQANEYFERVVFPVLTPLGHDPGRPFPYISNMSLNLAVLLLDPQGNERFARVKVPNTLPRLLPLKRVTHTTSRHSTTTQHDLVWMEQVIAANLSLLFPGMEILAAHPFRVTRDAEVMIQEIEADDLLETIEKSVRERRFGSVVRVTVDTSMPQNIRDVLSENLELEPNDIYTLEPPLGTSDLMSLYGLDRPDLKYPPFMPATPPELDEADDIFAAIRRQDILLHHPYDSFSTVVEFLRAATHDPNVLAIKMTLYRVGRNSPIVQTLLEAAANGKQVAVLVELKARFDEESNIEWAKSLEGEGVHVVYGLLGLKTHSKIALVVRKEGDAIRRYMHLSTGNYNVVNAGIYTDLGLLTCDEAMGMDASDIFNYLTGYSAKKTYRKFLVAPGSIRSGLTMLIEREISQLQQGQPGHLIFKLNSLVDREMIRLLYRASQAGVKIDLLVRGICCLRPQVAGLSDNIRVISIIGRFLEHSRIFYFRNGGHEEVYLGSADLMPRNLDRRVEILFPLEDVRLVRQLRDQALATYLADNLRAREMRSDGTYVRLKPVASALGVDCQAMFIKQRMSGVAEVMLPRVEVVGEGEKVL